MTRVYTLKVRFDQDEAPLAEMTILEDSLDPPLLAEVIRHQPFVPENSQAASFQEQVRELIQRAVIPEQEQDIH